MNIRIEVKKAVPGSKRTEYLKTYATKTEFFTTPDDFANDLGKALYSVEQLGFYFTTAEIYEGVLAGYQEKEAALKVGKFTNIYTLEDDICEEVLKVSVSK